MSDKKEWRHNPPTEKQIAYLARLGYDGPEPWSAGEASDEIDRLAPPVTDKQWDFLEELGYDSTIDGEISNKLGASKMIDKLIAVRDGAA